LLVNSRKKRALSTWLTTLESQFTDRILTVDSETAHLWGNLSARAQESGLVLHPVDGLLAATALRHGLYVMTHNAPHFTITGALVLDPWNGENKNHEIDGGS